MKKRIFFANSDLTPVFLESKALPLSSEVAYDKKALLGGGHSSHFNGRTFRLLSPRIRNPRGLQKEENGLRSPQKLKFSEPRVKRK